MRHDLWPSMKSGLAASLRFDGGMSRVPFWSWMGILNVTANLSFLVQRRLLSSKDPSWPDLTAFIKQNELVGMALQDMTDAWPGGFALTGFPLGYIGTTMVVIPKVMPVLLLVHLLSIGPVVRRSRDAGYAPFWTLLLLYWSVLSTSALLGLMMVLALVLGIGAMPLSIGIYGYLGYVNPTISMLAAFAALFILTTPTYPGPHPSKVS